MAISLREADFTIAFEELDGSPKEKVAWVPGQSGCQRAIQCAWNDRHQLAREFTGYYDINGSDTIQHMPHRYPLINIYLIATMVEISPVGKVAANADDDKLASYEKAQLDIEYTIPQIRMPSLLPGAIGVWGGAVSIHESIAAASEFITLPTKNLYWGKGGSSEPIDSFDAPAKVATILEWIYQVSGATYIPAGLNTYPGFINSAAVKSISLNYTFPEGTLLCGNPEIGRDTKYQAVEYNITLRFFYKNNGDFGSPKGWNYFPRTSASGESISWERITDGTDDKKIYEYADFGSVIV